MKYRPLKLGALFAVGAVMALGLTVTVRQARAAVPAPAADSVQMQLQRLLDRQQILELFTAYGATLDAHDFAAFGRLFAKDAVYQGGAGAPVHGRAAIQAMLQNIITRNPDHLPGPDFHLFFNPSIHVDGDRATAHSKGAYVVPNPRTKRAEIVFLVSYDDVLVRRGGHWLFLRRVIHGGIPAPAPAHK